jgi:hypothetical protein
MRPSPIWTPVLRWSFEAHALGMSPGLVDGRVRIVVPSWTNSKTIMMDVRIPEDIAALKAEVTKAGQSR